MLKKKEKHEVREGQANALRKYRCQREQKRHGEIINIRKDKKTRRKEVSRLKDAKVRRIAGSRSRPKQE